MDTVDWHRRRITNSTQEYNPPNKGEGTTIYLMDSGVDISHPELSCANIVNLYSYDGTWDDTEGPAGHGTGLASVIVGNTIGISSKVTLKIVKVPLGAGTPIDLLLNAFNFILADNITSIGIINCSWLVPKNEQLNSKMLELQEAGFIVVAAAGNWQSRADHWSPIGLEAVLGVAASDMYNRIVPWNRGVNGNNWGPEVDITAPGINVPLAAPDGTLQLASGTSIAAAITSGVIAQYISKFPEKTVSEIQNLVMSHSISNILLRDENMYGTTPNLLIQTYVDTIFTLPFNYLL